MSDELFGHYRLGEIIGRGNVSEVHRAVDVRKERTVAVKLLRPELAADAGFPDRFRHEAALAAGLAAPHVIPIHDYGNIDAIFYVEMPLVEGPDLASILARRGPLAPEAAVRIVTQVADALDAGHAEGLVHGDVKPSNILLTGDALDFAYLTDFGLARSWTGTPEQDHEADIHALAAVLGVALGGSLPPVPVRGDTTVRIPHAVPPALQRVVERGTATDPTDRFGTARELADAARGALGPAPDPRTETAIPAPPPPIPAPQIPAPSIPAQPVPAPVPEPVTAAIAMPSAVPSTVPPTAPPPPRRTISLGKALLITAVVAVLAVAGTLGLTLGRGSSTVAPAPPPTRLVPSLAATLPIGAAPTQAMISGDGRRVFVPTADGIAVLATTGPLTSASITTTRLPGERARPVGAFPYSGGILSPDGKRIYVPVGSTGAGAGLDVLDTTTMTSTGFLPYGIRSALTTGLDISPDGATIYASVMDVAAQPTGTVLEIIDTGSGAVTKEIPLGPGSASARLTTPGATAFALRLAPRDSQAIPTAAPIDLRSGTLGADLPLSFPIGMALAADRTTAYVSVSGGFAVIDTATGAVRRMLPVTSSRAFTAVLTPDGRALCYTTSAGVSVLDIASGVVTGSVAYRFAGSPGPISLAPDGKRAYVPDTEAGALLAVDLVPTP